MGTDDTDLVSEERFERIKFYLKHGRYPDGADRAEKSRLRSASTHYKLIPATEDEPEKLVLKGKEVISDPQRQYDVAWRVHSEQHGGINKTTATITENYHWVRIKDTVTQVIKNCAHCKEAPQRALAQALGSYGRREVTTKKTMIPPFDREFSVPPGEKSLWAHGYSADGLPITEPQPATPRADDDEPEPSFPQDNTAADATFGALMATADSIMPNFPEFPHDDNSVPVDPEIMNGTSDTPTNFHQLEEEVRRLQRSQVFGGAIFEPKDTAQPNEASNNSRRTSRRGNTAAPASGRTTTPASAPLTSRPAAPTPRNELDSDVIYVSSAGPELKSANATPAAASGVKRKGAPTEQQQPIGSAELRRVTRRLAGGSSTPTPQAGHVSEDAWRRSLNSG